MRAYEKKTQCETPASDALMIAGAAASRCIPWSWSRSRSTFGLDGAPVAYPEGDGSTNTPSVNRALSRDKGMTSRILHQAGLPVAQQHITRNSTEAALRRKRLAIRWW